MEEGRCASSKQTAVGKIKSEKRDLQVFLGLCVLAIQSSIQ